MLWAKFVNSSAVQCLKIPSFGILSNDSSIIHSYGGSIISVANDGSTFINSAIPLSYMG